jgi:hypothetical protein
LDAKAEIGAPNKQGTNTGQIVRGWHQESTEERHELWLFDH